MHYEIIRESFDKNTYIILSFTVQPIILYYINYIPKGTCLGLVVNCVKLNV